MKMTPTPFPLIGLAGGGNLYLYALANPLTNQDPTGLDTTGCDDLPDFKYLKELGATDCGLQCCAFHDECYNLFKCSSGSWPWPMGDFNKKNKCDNGRNCERCNDDVVGCFTRCALVKFGFKTPKPPEKYYCARTGSFVAKPDVDGCKKDHAPDCKGC